MNLFDPQGLKREIEELEKKTCQTGFWDDNQEAQRVLKQISDLRESVRVHEELCQEAEDICGLLQLTVQEDDQELYQETVEELVELQKRFEDYELTVLFTGSHDECNAIVALHAGTGGTDAQDWVEILLRMYTRWAEDNGYEVETLDFLAGDEAGVKSVTFIVNGRYAYGKLKAEKGVHRLIRVSPFDASGRRHTSFASVSVLPEVTDEVEVTINADDLRIDTFRSGGAGGQHVNKTDSAVRITHLPTGIVVQCQNERSQHANKLAAMKILKARLYETKQREHQDNIEQLKGEYKEITWGSQIRTYTLNPFSLVKDHRTGVEVGNVDAVLDGDINPFIAAYLRMTGRQGDVPRD